MSSSVRVRFAPSPTGYLHIGGARSALFNWLYARNKGGIFILRIEDTDAARNTPEARDAIMTGLAWLGIDWDEGPKLGGESFGDKGPYFQSQRSDIYQKYIEKLLSSGKAYEEDDKSVRFKLPKEPRTVHDQICGDVTFDLTMQPDPTIRRKDGSPVFHLVNVVDDLEMEVTHVIRGEDHLSNTPKHLALFEAFGAKPPAYAHIPLILNSNGSKMSKRDNGAAVGQYITDGYLPEAVRNYLYLLGWSPKDNREILDISEVIKKFDLPQVNRSNARFDIDKLYWINGQYWNKMSRSDYENFASDYLKSKSIDLSTHEPAYVRGALSIIREKIKVGRDLPEWIEPFLKDDFAYEAKATLKHLKGDGAIPRLEKIRSFFDSLEDLSPQTIEEGLKKLASEMDEKVSLLVHPTRLAVSGQPVGPSLYHMLEVMGKSRILSRIDRTLDLMRRDALLP